MRAGVSGRERRGAVLWEPGAGSRERCCTVNDRSPLPAPCSRRRSHSPGAARSLRPRWLRPVARVRCATCGGARGAHGRHPLCGRECTGRCGGAPGAEPARLRDDDSAATEGGAGRRRRADRKSTRLNSSHGYISYAVFCLKKKKTRTITSGCGRQFESPPKSGDGVNERAVCLTTTSKAASTWISELVPVTRPAATTENMYL